MEAYLRKKLHYPSAAKDSNIHGKVIVGFIVHEDGNISDPIIVKGIGGGCDEEALRLIKDMPFWAPCTQDGKPIKVFFTQPIWFRLAKG
jgi:protein TonB